jgi:DegV family protein with EDD domain
MRKYIIITDSTTDLTSEYATINDLVVVPLSFSIDGGNYKDYLDHRDLSSESFYEKIKSGHIGKTTQVNPDEFYEEFEKYAKQDIGILGIFFSSGLSGTFNSARIAREQILEKYPNAQIKIIDSLCASLGEGLLVDHAVRAKNKGMTLEENMKYIERIKLNISHWFTVMDMDTLKRGGRISASAAFFAKTLHINPVLHVSNEGKLVARMKKIGRKAALSALVDQLVETYDEASNDVIFISHSFAADVEVIKNMITEKTGISNFYENIIGPVIGSHTGIGTIAIFFVARER